VASSKHKQKWSEI